MERERNEGRKSGNEEERWWESTKSRFNSNMCKLGSSGCDWEAPSQNPAIPSNNQPNNSQNLGETQPKKKRTRWTWMEHGSNEPRWPGIIDMRQNTQKNDMRRARPLRRRPLSYDTHRKRAMSWRAGRGGGGGLGEGGSERADKEEKRAKWREKSVFFFATTTTEFYAGWRGEVEGVGWEGELSQLIPLAIAALGHQLMGGRREGLGFVGQTLRLLFEEAELLAALVERLARAHHLGGHARRLAVQDGQIGARAGDHARHTAARLARRRFADWNAKMKENERLRLKWPSASFFFQFHLQWKPREASKKRRRTANENRFFMPVIRFAMKRCSKQAPLHNNI